MSWQAYIDTSLVGTGKIDKGAIFSAAGDSVWAVTPGYDIKPDETKNIVANWSKNGNESPFFGSGVHIAGQKYICVAHDDTHIYARHGKEGVVITKSNQALIIAHHPDTIDRVAATDTTKALADYLKGVGY